MLAPHLLSGPDGSGVNMPPGEMSKLFCWKNVVSSLAECSSNMQSVSQGRICSDNCTCCHTGTKAAKPTRYFTVPQLNECVACVHI